MGFDIEEILKTTQTVHAKPQHKGISERTDRI